MSTHSHYVGRQTAFCRHPAEWWKSNDLAWALVHHPAGGYVKVASVVEVLKGEASYERVAERAGVSVAEIRQWERDLETLVRRVFWRAYVQQRDEAQRIRTHPFVSYYGTD